MTVAAHGTFLQNVCSLSTRLPDHPPRPPLPALTCPSAPTTVRGRPMAAISPPVTSGAGSVRRRFRRRAGAADSRSTNVQVGALSWRRLTAIAGSRPRARQWPSRRGPQVRRLVAPARRALQRLVVERLPDVVENLEGAPGPPPVVGQHLLEQGLDDVEAIQDHPASGQCWAPMKVSLRSQQALRVRSFRKSKNTDPNSLKSLKTLEFT